MKILFESFSTDIRESVQVVLRRMLVTILMMMFFISCLVTCAPVAQQKKEKAMSEDLLSVNFPTEKEGWICGRWGIILHTTDEGKTWVLQSSGTENTLVSIHFVDSQNGWAVGEEGIILHTADGGKTWEKQKSPVPFYLMKVFFVTPLKGWIVGERTHILSTVDGGKTWMIHFKDEDFILKSISFCDPLHGWAVGEYGFIYHTKDGGLTWKKQAGNFDISEETGAVEGGNFLFDVKAVDPKTAWAVGIDGYVIRTVDGGKTWKEVKTDAPKTQLFCVDSNRAGIVLIGGNGTILISTDNGKTWKNPTFEPPIIYGWVYGLARRGTSEFAVVVRKEGHQLDQEAIINFCASKLAGYKKPKRVEFMDDLPKNPSGKVTKNVLRDPYWASRKKRI